MSCMRSPGGTMADGKVQIRRHANQSIWAPADVPDLPEKNMIPFMR
jgi:hypothetical protein